MKVLLVQDVEKLGKAGDIRDVARGFGRNYLLPKGFAVLATRGQIRQAEERLQAQRRRDEAARRDDEALAARLNGLKLHFTARVGELDRLYGSVTNTDIANKIVEQTSIEIDRRKIDLEDPIKRVGIYPVKVHIATGLDPVLNVVVEAEGSTDSAAPSSAPEGTEERSSEPSASPEPEAEVSPVEQES